MPTRDAVPGQEPHGRRSASTDAASCRKHCGGGADGAYAVVAIVGGRVDLVVARGRGEHGAATGGWWSGGAARRGGVRSLSGIPGRAGADTALPAAAHGPPLAARAAAAVAARAAPGGGRALPRLPPFPDACLRLSAVALAGRGHQHAHLTAERELITRNFCY